MTPQFAPNATLPDILRQIAAAILPESGILRTLF